MKLNVGDVVVLKSGGPKMTVNQTPFRTLEGKEDETKALCEWFNENGQLKSFVFNIDELEKL